MPENALGKGLDALIQDPNSKKKDDTDKDTDKSATKKKTKTTKKSKKKSTNESTNTSQLPENKLKEIRTEVEKNPRITLWSPQSAATLRYLRKTIPEFSISNEASLLLEEAIKEKYPDIWEIFSSE